MTWHYSCEHPHLTTPQHIPFANEVIVLARRCKMPKLLKRAFYELARSTGLGQDEEDTGEEEDGKVDACGGGDGPLKSSVKAKERIILRRDLVLLIKTREQLALQWLLTAGSAPPTKEFPCPLAPIPAPSNSSQPPDPVPTGGKPSEVTPSYLSLSLSPPPRPLPQNPHPSQQTPSVARQLRPTTSPFGTRTSPKAGSTRNAYTIRCVGWRGSPDWIGRHLGIARGVWRRGGRRGGRRGRRSGGTWICGWS